MSDLGMAVIGDKIKVRLALLKLMGTVKKPALVSYWKQDPAMLTLFFLKMMSHDQFLVFLQILHFNSG